MKKYYIFIVFICFFIAGCAGAHYQALPSAPKMEKGQQRIAINLSVSLGEKKKLKWYIPRNWWISNWGYSLEYRYGVGNDTDIGIYPAGLNILPCALDIRWLDKEIPDKINFHRVELFFNPITYNNSNISNSGIRYDYFNKKKGEENITGVQGVSFLIVRAWDSENSDKHWFYAVPGLFWGQESENVLYELDYLPGFNYFMEKPQAPHPILNFSHEKDNLIDFLTNDLFFGISHGNSYTE